jgi:hypothetical protein
MKTLARERDKTEIILRLRTLRVDSVRRWGRMSVHEMVCHLSDGYRLVTGERATRLSPSLLPRPIMKGFALYLPVRWPAGIQTTPDLDQARGGTRPSNFDTDVRTLERLIDEVATTRAAGGRVHPLFGTMSESAWLRWAYLHADHHFRQFGV